MFFIEKRVNHYRAKAKRKQAEIQALKSDLLEARKLLPANGTSCTITNDCHRVRIAGGAATMARVEGISLKEIGTDAQEMYVLTRYYSEEMMAGRKRNTHQ
jgi:hypothetical protein